MCIAVHSQRTAARAVMDTGIIPHAPDIFRNTVLIHVGVPKPEKKGFGVDIIRKKVPKYRMPQYGTPVFDIPPVRNRLHGIK